MSKKNVKQIGNYYKKKDVVSTYDDRRFAGKGGAYIHSQELEPVLSFLKKQDISGEKLLDIGAGRGRLSKPVAELGYDVHCLDFSEEMIAELAKTFEKKKLVQQSIFDPIKFKKKFAVITSMRFFDHFSLQDQKKILTNVIKKLSNDGAIIMPTLNAHSLESWLASLFPYGRYNYFYSINQYKNLFESVGLELVSHQSKFFLPRGLFLKLNGTGPVLQLAMGIDKLLSSLFKNNNAYFYFFLKKK